MPRRARQKLSRTRQFAANKARRHLHSSSFCGKIVLVLQLPLVGEAGGDGIVRVRADVFVCVHSDDSNALTMINNSTEAIQVAGWETVFYITPLVWSESKQRAGDK